MRRFLAILCTLIILCSSLNLAVFATVAETENVQTNAVVLESNTADLVIESGETLDLNGYSVNNLHVNGEGAVYCTDSATDDYTVADGVYGKITGTVEGTVLPADGYMQVTEEDGISFHSVSLNINAMTLRPDAAGVYYTSNFAGDEVVAAQVESYGVALSVKGEPTPGDKNCGYSTFSNFQAGEGANAAASGTLLKNILKTTNTDAANTRNANMAVYGRAYLKTADGYVFGETVTRSLKEQVEAVDAVWGTLQPKQKAAAVAMYNTYTGVMSGWNIPNMIAYSGTEIQPGLDGEITLPISVNVVDGVVAEEVTVSVEGISVTVPAGVKLAEGATSLTLKVTPLETSEITIELTASQVLMPVDVHVDGISAENTVPLTIGLGAVMAKDLNMGNYAVYHVENGKAGKMVLISSDKPFTAHNQYKYTLDGELTLHMATFSEVAVISDTNNYWQGGIDTSWYSEANTENAGDVFEIRTADQLAGFNKIVSGDTGYTKDSFAGDTVILASNIAFFGETEDKSLIFYPIGYWKTAGVGNNGSGTDETWYEYGGAFKGTFNGNGHTVSNLYQQTWAMDGNYDKGYWKAAMGLFGYVYGGTIKNLTINNFVSVGEFASTGCVATCAASDEGSSVNFENISVINSHPQAYNVPVSGVVGYAASNDGNQSTLNFKNITVDNSNTISALWGTYDACCAGILATTRANTIVNLENCHVAAKMDVYNDVCANYQYYWYRGSGMLVGGIRNVKNGEVDISNIHATNCTVDFGDWNNYYYCEFVKNGNPSYCNKETDFKFSRIPESELNINKETNEATCIGHDHDGVIENNAAVLLPFYQLFAGRYDGTVYGIRNISVYDVNKYDTVNIKATAAPTNTVKFQAKVETDTVFKKGATITLGELFENYITTDYLPINDESVWANAVDTATGIDVATFTQDKTDWTKSTLTFKDSFMGQVKVTIQDYQFCQPTVLTIQVGDLLEKIDAMDFSKGDGLASGKTFEAYCPVCDETVIWTARLGSSRIEYISKAGNYHYYLSGDVTRIRTEAIKTQEFFNNASNVADINCCLYLNGKNIVADGQIAVSGSATLNILGDGNVTFVLPEDTATITGNLSATLCNNGGTFNIYGGTYTTTAPNKPVILSNNATNTVNIYAGTFIGAENGTAGNVVINKGTFNMYGGIIKDGTSTGNGGNLYVAGETYIGKDAVITNGTAYKGGNVFVNATTFTTAGKITNGTALTKIVSSKDEASGGNFFVSGAATLNIAGGEISNGIIKKNTAADASVGSWSSQCYGPNIRTYGANVNVSGGLIYGGSSEAPGAEGWNLYTYANGENGNVTISGGTIVGDVFASGAKSLKLSGAPQIVKSLTLEDGTEVTAQKYALKLLAATDISELDPAANICVSANSGTNICAANANTQNVVTCFTNYNDNLGIFLTTDNTNDPNRQKQDNSINNAFLRVTTGRNQYCQFCNKVVSWVQVGKTYENGRVGYLNNNGSAHYYLADNFTSVAAQFTDLASTDLCLDLCGYTLTMPGRMHLGNTSASINLVANGGSVVFTGTAGSSYIDAAFVVGSKMNVVGGTYTTADAALAAGTPVFLVTYNKEADLTLTDATVAGKLVATTGNTTLAGTTTVDAIEVGPNAKLTIAEDWTGTANVTFVNGATPAGNGLADGDFAGELICGSYKLIHQDGKLAQDEDRSFDPNANLNYCERCDKFAKWTALRGSDHIGLIRTDNAANSDKHEHYYLADHMNYTGTDPFVYVSRESNENQTPSSVCLNLNGKTLNTSGILRAGSGCFLTIYGNGGTINYTGDTKLFQFETATAKLYGGTYNIGSGTGTMNSSNAEINFYDGAVVNGVLAASNGRLYLFGDSRIDRMTLSGSCKITIDAGWSGTAVLTTSGGVLEEDGKTIKAENVVIGGAYTGTITNLVGNPYKNVNGQLTVVYDTPVWGKFDPVRCNGYAYCEHCGEEAGAVEWKAVEGSSRIGYISDGKQHHYYLSGDVDVDIGNTQTLAIIDGSSVCLNLNGHDMINHGRISAEGTGTLAIMGAGNVTFAADMTWNDGGKATAEQIALYKHALVANCAGVYIYGGTYGITGNAVALGLPTIEATCPVYIKNATVNGYIAAGNNANIHLEKDAKVEEIRISGSGKVTVTEGWSGTATLNVAYDATTGIVPAANAVVLGTLNGNLTLPSGRKLVQNGEGLMLDPTFDANYTLNYCEHCKEFVEWTALHEGERVTGAAAHWYVADDMQAKSGERLIYGSDFKSASVCLHLNGKTLTSGATYSDAAIYASNATTINIMGDGEIVNGGTGFVFKIATGTINLYGGTYTSANNKVVVTEKGSGLSTMNLYGNATVGTMIASHINCRITLDSSWTGSLKLDASALMVDQKLPALYLTVESGQIRDGAITDQKGNALYYIDGQLCYKPFDAAAETNYCRVCNAYVAWESLPETLETFPLDGTHYHFFVENDMEYKNTNMFYAKDADTDKNNNYAPKVCLYLNNKTLTMKDCLYASNGGTFNIIGDGTLTSKSGYVIRGATSYIHLYGGTYIAPTGGGVYSRADAGTPNLYVHEDAKLQGNVLVTHGTVTIYDQAEIEKITVKDASTTFASSWTGTASLEVLESLLENGLVVPTKYVKVNGTGTITSTQGDITVANGQITITPTTPAE